ncbi:unnamed protein product [Acanthoscelides obtectus]|uniref:Uncharacterized protein n=1 Tax=Acanthoscelides obtectus TaxID=200917 RepID=A0A9P0MAF8_ACAOB|nr:unnamed protein product [Acanthoscelides obtectus]CAK1662830.1 hypothetical protein AOBTE_LOCUS23342 [Acanthoscelides obtectus]
MKRRQRVAYFSSFCIVIAVGRAFTTARNHRETVTKYLYTVLSLGTEEAFDIVNLEWCEITFVKPIEGVGRKSR